MQSSRAKRRPDVLTFLRNEERGAVTIEYLVVTVIGLFVCIELGLLGVSMLRAYGASLQVLYSEFP